MNEGQIFSIVVVAIITSGITLSMIVQAWVQTRTRKEPKAPQARLEAIDARLSRMEERIETIAIEMERVAEGQRFTAKLLADRASAAAQPLARPAPQSESRITTPH